VIPPGTYAAAVNTTGGGGGGGGGGARRRDARPSSSGIIARGVRASTSGARRSIRRSIDRMHFFQTRGRLNQSINQSEFVSIERRWMPDDGDQ
jgi:hypothetical protein